MSSMNTSTMASAGQNQEMAATGNMVMTMTFVQSLTTPLLWASWRPRNAGEYAASCLFLVALAALTRVLVAIRPVLDAASWRRRPKHPYYRHDPSDRNSLHAEHDSSGGSNDANSHLPPPERRPVSGGRAIMLAVQDHWGNAALSSRLARAAFDTVIAGLGYLVMLAVMTMNVGYFLAVLGGVFLGTFLLAVPTSSDAHRGPDDCG